MPPERPQKPAGKAPKSIGSKPPKASTPATPSQGGKSSVSDVESHGPPALENVQTNRPSLVPGRFPEPKNWKLLHDKIIMDSYLGTKDKRFLWNNSSIDEIKECVMDKQNLADLVQGTFDIGYLLQRLEEVLHENREPPYFLYQYWAVVPQEWRLCVCFACYDRGNKKRIVYFHLQENVARCAYCGTMPCYWDLAYAKHPNASEYKDGPTGALSSQLNKIMKELRVDAGVDNVADIEVTTLNKSISGMCESGPLQASFNCDGLLPWSQLWNHSTNEIPGGLRLWGFPRTGAESHDQFLQNTDAQKTLEKYSKRHFHCKGEKKNKATANYATMCELSMKGLLEALLLSWNLSQKSSKGQGKSYHFGIIHLHNALEKLNGPCTCRTTNISSRKKYIQDKTAYDTVNQYFHDQVDPAPIAPGSFNPTCAECGEKEYHFIPRTKKYSLGLGASRFCGNCGNDKEWRFPAFHNDGRIPPRVCKYQQMTGLAGEEAIEMDNDYPTMTSGHPMYMTSALEKPVRKASPTTTPPVCKFKFMGPVSKDPAREDPNYPEYPVNDPRY